jgi:hypothetical protein
MIHGLDTGFLVAAEVTEHAEHRLLHGASGNAAGWFGRERQDFLRACRHRNARDEHQRDGNGDRDSFHRVFLPGSVSSLQHAGYDGGGRMAKDTSRAFHDRVDAKRLSSELHLASCC